MIDDWAVGDLALCVDASLHLEAQPEEPWYPRHGFTYRVERLGVVVGIVCLGLEEDQLSHKHGWDAHCFRKIRPDAHEGSADDWALILETTKRKVRA